MAENDCLNPEQHCELHICQLRATDRKQEIEELFKTPKFVCTNCGSKVNRAENLCRPKPL